MQTCKSYLLVCGDEQTKQLISISAEAQQGVPISFVDPLNIRRKENKDEQVEIEHEQSKEEQVALEKDENEDCVDGQHDYEHKDTHEDLLELCFSQGER